MLQVHIFLILFIFFKLTISLPADFEDYDNFGESQIKKEFNLFQSILNDAKANNKKVAGIYGQFSQCEGRFTRMQMDVIDLKYEWKCDHAWTHHVNISANGYRNDKRLPFEVLSQQIVKDFHGNEDYNSKGTVSGGECKGAQLIVQSELKRSKGSCDTGVTELYSDKLSALVSLKGSCETTCHGTIWVHYWPAKI